MHDTRRWSYVIILKCFGLILTSAAANSPLALTKRKTLQSWNILNLKYIILISSHGICDIDNINPTGKWKLQLFDMTWNVFSFETYSELISYSYADILLLREK